MLPPLDRARPNVARMAGMDDETLEVGIAAGLDVSTAIVLADEQERPPRRKVGCLGCLILLIAAGLALVLAS